jgi:hypothetical protein
LPAISEAGFDASATRVARTLNGQLGALGMLSGDL